MVTYFVSASSPLPLLIFFFLLIDKWRLKGVDDGTDASHTRAYYKFQTCPSMHKNYLCTVNNNYNNPVCMCVCVCVHIYAGAIVTTCKYSAIDWV